MTWLESIPLAFVYPVVALVIGLQFLCLPLPGGVALTAAALLAVHGRLDPWLMCACAVLGVIAGSLAGYRIGRRGGRPLLGRLGRRFPRVLSTRNLTRAEASFERWGVWVVTISCFSAALRMLAAPLAGMLGLPLGRFVAAMSVSAIAWTAGTTAALYYVADLAQAWLNWLSWAGLAMLAVLLLASVPAWFRHPQGNGWASTQHGWLIAVCLEGGTCREICEPACVDTVSNLPAARPGSVHR